MELNKAMSICIKARLRIYPVKTKEGFFVRVEKDTESSLSVSTSKIPHKNNKDVMEAVQKSYIYYGEKLSTVTPKNNN